MRKLILSALLLASAFQTAFGQTFTSGDYQYTLSNNQATITRYIGAGGAVSIPETLNFNPVVSIGSNAFASCYNLVSVSIPYRVTSIGSNAFASCYSLVSVSIPYRVRSIGSSAFQYCFSLGSVSIPYSVTSIGSSAFQYCTSLGSVSIPNSGTIIGSGAFADSALGSVFLSPNLSSSQISQAGFPSTAVFYVGSVGAPTSTATQADLATTNDELASTKAELASTKAELAKIKADLAKTKTDLGTWFAKFPSTLKRVLPKFIWSK